MGQVKCDVCNEVKNQEELSGHENLNICQECLFEVLYEHKDISKILENLSTNKPQKTIDKL